MSDDRVPHVVIPLPARENIRAKSIRYLIEGRLSVLLVKGCRISAEVQGETGIWHPHYVRGDWRCDCPARRRCAHIAALRLVVDEPPVEEPRGG